MDAEGVIKFTARHRRGPLDPAHLPLVRRLIAWRDILVMAGLVGRDPARYGGAGFGNLSGRLPPPSAGLGRRRFLITGSQTGGVTAMGPEHFSAVERYWLREGAVDSAGPALPSSESMTHGAIYDLSPHIRFVFHAHAPAIWRRAAALGLPTTRPEVPYGTREMAEEVQRLYRTTALPERRVLAMAGHEDGVIAFGATAREAGTALLAELATAHEMAAAGR